MFWTVPIKSTRANAREAGKWLDTRQMKEQTHSNQYFLRIELTPEGGMMSGLRAIPLVILMSGLPVLAQLTVNPLGGLPNRPYVIARAVSNGNPFVVGAPAERVAGEAST